MRALISTLTLLFGCMAQPPEPRGGANQRQANFQEYPNVANCNPSSACPGLACAENVIGPPDGVGVSMAQCRALDLVFTGGNIIARRGEPDLRFYLTGPVSGRTRIEASADGEDYRVVGFIGDLPDQTSNQCRSTRASSANQALVDFSQCNHISNVAFVRLSTDTSTAVSAVIDAVEAISVQPGG